MEFMLRNVTVYGVGQWYGPVAYQGILFGGGGGQKFQLRTEDRENGELGAVAP